MTKICGRHSSKHSRTFCRALHARPSSNHSCWQTAKLWLNCSEESPAPLPSVSAKCQNRRIEFEKLSVSLLAACPTIRNSQKAQSFWKGNESPPLPPVSCC